jgi:hypothetical protein
MESLEKSFSVEDHAFYEREFSFFNKVTGISGSLRPFIHSPKEVKKQKIEEELRKIEVEVGVYLPSNPEGVVVGIDRKSGKPLQSHAKAASERPDLTPPLPKKTHRLAPCNRKKLATKSGNPPSSRWETTAAKTYLPSK